MKVILIILDGLNYQVAEKTMGYLLTECQAQKGHLRAIQSVPPAISRPLYETILTGKTSKESGITDNETIQLSKEKSIFHFAQSIGKKGAAAASHYFSELYNHAPFEPISWRFVVNPHLTIPYGIFYYDAAYPDSHIFSDAEYLRVNYNPDFLLIHPMGIGKAGRQYGGESTEYRKATQYIDETLSEYLPTWLKEGYTIFITADHGITIPLSEAAKLTQQTLIPLFILGKKHQTLQPEIIEQTDLCSTICQLLE